MQAKTELKQIREAFHAKRPQFAEVFLGISVTTLYFYETGRLNIPNHIMAQARKWKEILTNMEQSK